MCVAKAITEPYRGKAVLKNETRVQAYKHLFSFTFSSSSTVVTFWSWEMCEPCEFNTSGKVIRFHFARSTSETKALPIQPNYFLYLYVCMRILHLFLLYNINTIHLVHVMLCCMILQLSCHNFVSFLTASLFLYCLVFIQASLWNTCSVNNLYI